jgi:hypothetical protein
MISLAPPRKPGGTRIERNWTVIVSYQGVSQHIALYATHAGDPKGAQTVANQTLGQDYTWTATGPGFRAELENK